MPRCRGTLRAALERNVANVADPIGSIAAMLWIIFAFTVV
jgi:hypothetical protein